MSGSRANQWRALKAKIAGLEGLATANGDVRVFGDADLDGVFPAGGLPLGRWHEVVGNGLEIETAAAACKTEIRTAMQKGRNKPALLTILSI